MADAFLGTIRCPMGAYVAADGSVRADRYTTEEERKTRKDKPKELADLEASRMRCVEICKVFRVSPATLKVICPKHEVVWVNASIWIREVQV